MAMTLSSLARSKLILATADRETATWCSDFIGHRQVRDMEEALEKIGELHESGIEGGVGAGISRAGTGERHQRGQDVVLELGTPGKLERGIHEAGPFED
jgi:hypothetical protein